ncbi:glutathione-dependent formaldehyde-activating enzyme [Sphingorhabdus sp. SMR4y]|nr:glutathione-dependent formaldehyde-activating enzyme [Sphingorhabdus sp. SMR4y]
MLDCNCSICARTGFLHLFVPHRDFTLLKGEGGLTSYRFGSGQAHHLFCKNCGVKSFYQPRSHPDSWSVNYNCLDDGHDLEPSIRKFDGRNWETAKARLA